MMISLIEFYKNVLDFYIIAFFCIYFIVKLIIIYREGKRYEVLNFGVVGYTTKQEIEKSKTSGLKFSPDIVMIAYFNNDFENKK